VQQDQGWQNVVEQNTAEGVVRTVFCGIRTARMGGEQLPFVICRLFCFIYQKTMYIYDDYIPFL